MIQPQDPLLECQSEMRVQPVLSPALDAPAVSIMDHRDAC